MSLKGKTTTERALYRPGLDGKRAAGNRLLQAEGRSEPSDFGETAPITYAPGLRTRMIACREDRRIKRTPENDETIHALILEAHAAGWLNSEIERSLWLSHGQATNHFNGHSGSKWESA